MGNRKRFNTTGICIPSLHYMADTTDMIDQIITDYIEPGEYFTINRARQFGKTTTLELLYHKLKEKYIIWSKTICKKKWGCRTKDLKIGSVTASFPDS